MPKANHSASKGQTLTTATYAFIHQKDVDTDKHLNAKPIDALMEEGVSRAAAALATPFGSHTAFQTKQMAALLTSMRWTHRAIRRVLGWKDADLPMAIDGLSLARFPLEGLYSLSLMLESPTWVDRYMQYGWAQQYRRFLLQCEETKLLPRFAEFSKVTGAQSMEGLRMTLGVTSAQKATIDHEEVGTPLPSGLTPSPIYPFPTPRKAIDNIAPGTKRTMLMRLYPEYQWLCAFVHGASDSSFYKLASDPQARLGFDAGLPDDDVFHRRVREPAYLASLLSVMQATAEISAMYPSDIGLAATVTKCWIEVSEGTLLGRTIWEIRTKGLLGIIG